MAAKSNTTWIVVGVGAVVAYWLYRRQETDAVSLPAPAPTPSGTTPRAPTTPAAPHAPVTPAPLPPTTTAPPYAVAHPCSFGTTETHAVYNDLSASFAAGYLAAGSTVTVTEKRVAAGATWFRATMRADDLSLASYRTDRPYWFRPNAAELARCAE